MFVHYFRSPNTSEVNANNPFPCSFKIPYFLETIAIYLTTHSLSDK